MKNKELRILLNVKPNTIYILDACFPPKRHTQCEDLLNVEMKHLEFTLFVTLFGFEPL